MLSTCTQARWTAGAIALALLAAGRQDPTPEEGRTPEDPDEELAVRIERLARTAVDETGLAGLALVVSVGPREIVADGWGYADAPEGELASPERRMPAGAMIEPLVAAGLLALEQEGALALDDPITKHFPALGFDGAGITIEHLLRHTSGLPSYDGAPLEGTGRGSAEDGDDPEAPALEAGAVALWLAERPLEAAPGERYAWRATDLLLAGSILEEVAGVTALEFFQQRFFGPLEMASTGACGAEVRLRRQALVAQESPGGLEALPSGPAPLGAERLCASARDLARWQRALAERRALADAAYQAMTSPTVLADGSRVAWGLGVALPELGGEAGTSWGGAASGGRVHVAHYADRDVTIALLAQAEDAPLDALQRAIAREIFDLPQPEVQDLPLEPAEMARYVGGYYVGSTRYLVEPGDEHLRVTPPVEPAFDLLYQGDDVFVSKDDSDVRLVFHVEGERAHEFVLDDHGMRTTAKRLD